MKISDVYDKFSIPPNLQEHMLRVCAIIEFIQKHWKGSTVNWEQTRKLALVHDLGNLVRFDFDNHPEFLGSEQKNVSFWKMKQKEIQSKYGLDDHEATRKMVKELGLLPTEIDTITSKSFMNSIVSRDSKSWPLKLLSYADLRTMPNGIGSINERIEEVKSRRPDIVNNPNFNAVVNACLDIEKQIESNMDCSLAKITDNSAPINKDDLNLVMN